MKAFLHGLRNYLLFFLLCAFLVTCCILLFMGELMNAMDITLTAEHLNTAAKLTFANVMLLSLLFTLLDVLRRKVTVERTTRHIAEAAQKVVAGDFSVRVAPVNMMASDESFNVLIDCFNRMTEELSSVEMLRTDFISNVSHEMKTPLSVIQNYGTLLQAPNLPEEKRQEYARGVMQAARRLSDMITNILRLNKLENQQIFMQEETFDLGEQLCEALLQYESTWEQENIELDTDIAPDVTIRADKSLLLLVWNNLLSNAFKFTPPGGCVRLTLTADAETAVVSVQDTGCGMSPETGAHIFEKFYQGDASHAVQGNGLGLALVKRIVDIVGGSISVSSVPGKGSTFSVTIGRNG